MLLCPCLRPRETGCAIWLISLVSSETAEDHDIYIGGGNHPRRFPGRWYPGYGDGLWGAGLKLCGELALRGAFGATRASGSVNFRKSGETVQWAVKRSCATALKKPNMLLLTTTE
jgi:hypothetical protein